MLFIFLAVLIFSAVLTVSGYAFDKGHKKIAATILSTFFTIMVVIPGIYVKFFFPSLSAFFP